MRHEFIMTFHGSYPSGIFMPMDMLMPLPTSRTSVSNSCGNLYVQPGAGKASVWAALQMPLRVPIFLSASLTCCSSRYVSGL